MQLMYGKRITNNSINDENRRCLRIIRTIRCPDSSPPCFLACLFDSRRQPPPHSCFPRRAPTRVRRRGGRRQEDVGTDEAAGESKNVGSSMTGN